MQLSRIVCLLALSLFGLKSATGDTPNKAAWDQGKRDYETNMGSFQKDFNAFDQKWKSEMAGHSYPRDSTPSQTADSYFEREQRSQREHALAEMQRAEDQRRAMLTPEERAKEDEAKRQSQELLRLDEEMVRATAAAKEQERRRQMEADLANLPPEVQFERAKVADEQYYDRVGADMWYRSAAEKGSLAAQCSMGLRYLFGMGYAKQFGYDLDARNAEGLRWLRSAAEQGLVVAMGYLGRIYLEGKGVAKNHDEGIKWLQKAADRGDASAMFNLGGPDWIRLAAINKYWNAYGWIAYYYEHGENGFPKDPLEAYRWNCWIDWIDDRHVFPGMEAAKRLHLKEAVWRKVYDEVYRLRGEGRDTPVSDIELTAWLREAAGHDNSFAQNYLGTLYLNGQVVPQDRAEAARWFRASAERGNPLGQYNLGLLYLSPMATADQAAEAAARIRSAAEQGHVLAQSKLGDLYQEGNRVPQDLDEARKWYEKAANQGDQPARTRLAERAPLLIAQLIEQGKAEIKNKNFAGAIVVFTDLIQREPKNSDPYFWRGLAKDRKDDVDGALADYTASILIDPNGLGAGTTHYARGLAEFVKNDRAGAIADFTAAVYFDPNLAGVAYAARGRAWEMNGDPRRAIIDCTASLTLGRLKHPARVYRVRARAEQTLGDLDGAIADYERAVASDPDDAFLAADLANARRTKGGLKNEGIMLPPITPAAKSASNEPPLDRRAEAKHPEGDSVGADDDNLFFGSDPTGANAFVTSAEANEAHSDHTGAIADCDLAIALNPKCAKAFLVRGEARQRRDANIDGAMADFDRAITLNPNDANAFVLRGIARIVIRDYAGAIANLDRGIKLDPQNVGALDNRALAKVSMQDLDGALADYDRILKLQPNNANAASWRRELEQGKRARDKVDSVGAVAEDKRAVATDPSDANAYVTSAETKAAKSDHDGAIADCDRAIALSPNCAKAFLVRGKSKESRDGDHDGAIADFDRAIILNPNDAHAFVLRGIAQIMKQDSAAAIVSFDCAMRIDPKSAEAFSNRAWAKAAVKDFDGAIADYSRAIELDPNDISAVQYRDLTVLGKRNFDEANGRRSDAGARNPPAVTNR